MGYTVEQKWSPTTRKLTKKWTIRNTETKRLMHTSSSYGAAVKWIRKKAKK